MSDAPTPADNLVLRRLESMRRELSAFPEESVRDRQLLVRMYEEMTREFGRTRTDLGDLRKDVQELRSDMLLLENKLLNRHNEVLSLIERLDALEEQRAQS